MDRNSKSVAGQRALMTVALRKESVDRNCPALSARPIPPASLSARRAWIEIQNPARYPRGCFVALRKESVDRNIKESTDDCQTNCRSPQGEHGIFLFLTVQGGLFMRISALILKIAIVKTLA